MRTTLASEPAVPGAAPSRWRAGRWLQRHPLLVDVVVTVLVGAVVVGSYVATGIHGDAEQFARPVDALGFVFVAVATAPLVARRRQPLAAFGVSLTGAALYVSFGYGDGAIAFPLFIILGTIAAGTPRRTSLRVLAVAEVVMFPSYVLAAHRHHDAPAVVSALVSCAFLAVPWVFGENVRHRRRTYAEAQERAARAERERADEARKAVADERTRIARELHDVVAHAMTVMVVQAAGARRVLETRPEARADAIEALNHVEHTGREGLAEMRRLLGVLRSTPDPTAAEASAATPAIPELAPQPGAADVASLVRSWTDAGLSVDVDVDGNLADLPPGVDLAAYRIIQEALTNTFKHAGPATAHVSLALDSSALIVEITDDGRGAAAVRPATPGHGLVGMHERVALYGGTLDAGPRTGGGFAVRARLPLSAGAHS